MFMKAVMAVCPDSVALEWLGVDRGIWEGCGIALGLFLQPNDELMEETILQQDQSECIEVGDMWANVDYADDAELLAELLSIM